MVRIVVCGAGNVGRKLIDLLGDRHEIVVIDCDRDVCNSLASERAVTVINRDATDPEILDELDLPSRDLLFAVTGSEESNFLISVYAKHAGVRRVMCRVSCEKSARILEKMGIEAVTTEYTLAQEMANRALSPCISELLTPDVSKLELIEKRVENAYVGKTVEDYNRHMKSVALALYDGEKYVLARPTTVIQEGMVIILLRERGFKLL